MIMADGRLPRGSDGGGSGAQAADLGALLEAAEELRKDYQHDDQDQQPQQPSDGP